MPSVREKIREEYVRLNEIEQARRANPDYVFPDDAPVEALKPALSARAFNCLRNGDFQTVADIRKLSLRELMYVPNLGHHSAAEITRVVNGGHDWNFERLRNYLTTQATPEHAVQIASELEKLVELAKEIARRS
jgi:DNA-directed RNA polymerase alpha subunit